MKTLKIYPFLAILCVGTAHSYVGGREGKVEDAPASVRFNFFWFGDAETPEDSHEGRSEKVFKGASQCTAVKVQEQSYLTAAHCVLSEDKHVLGAISLSQDPFMSEDDYGTFVKPQRIYVSRDFVGCSNSLNPIWIFDCMDLALIELVDTTNEIPVAELAPFTLKRGANIVAGGYGSTTFHEYILTQPFKDYPTHLRYDERRVDKVKKQTFTLRSKRSGLKIDADWNEMAEAYQVADGKRRDPRKLKRDSEKLHRYGQLAPGDSGGPAWMTVMNKNYIVGINSLYRMKLPGYDLFRRANNIEYIVRVDLGSTGHEWVKNILKEIETVEADQSGFIIR
jgi:hypothetical protein